MHLAKVSQNVQCFPITFLGNVTGALAVDLSIVREREKLKPNKKAEPSWQRIRPGCYLGFVPSAKGGQGSWVARAYDEETRRYRRKALGAFPELSGDKKFTAAKAEAER